MSMLLRALRTSQLALINRILSAFSSEFCLGFMLKLIFSLKSIYFYFFRLIKYYIVYKKFGKYKNIKRSKPLTISKFPFCVCVLYDVCLISPYIAEIPSALFSLQLRTVCNGSSQFCCMCIILRNIQCSQESTLTTCLLCSSFKACTWGGRMNKSAVLVSSTFIQSGPQKRQWPQDKPDERSNSVLFFYS